LQFRSEKVNACLPALYCSGRKRGAVKFHRELAWTIKKKKHSELCVKKDLHIGFFMHLNVLPKGKRGGSDLKKETHDKGKKKCVQEKKKAKQL